MRNLLICLFPARLCNAPFLAMFIVATGGITTLRGQPVSNPLPHFWRTDGPVNSIVVTNNMAYLGGDFHYLGPASGAAGKLDADFGDPIPGFPRLDGVVRSIIPDGSGGWFVGGLFTAVANTNLANLVHVRSDNTLDAAFRPDPNSTVRALALSGGTLIVAGEFSQIATNQQATYFALLNSATGGTNGIRTRATGPVNALALDGDIVYLGGTFTSLIVVSNNSQQLNYPRQRLAAVNVRSGQVEPWDPGCTGGFEGVKALAVSPTAIYAGGDFTQCGTKPRNCIASLNKTDGVAGNWNPNAQFSGATPSVNAMALVNNVLYVGGDFSSIGARSRVRLAALQPAGFGQADANWQADADDIVAAIVPLGTDLLVAGKFTRIGGSIVFDNGRPVQTGGTERRGFARIAQADATVSDWGPQVSTLKPASSGNATSWALARQGSFAILGGDFVSFGGVNRSRLAAIDLTTGVATAWDPNADLEVRVLSLARRGLYVGGTFTNIGGVLRPRIALLNYQTGQVDPWNPQFQAGQFVAAIAPGTNSVFVGGQFSKIGGQDRLSLAELDFDTGAATAWNPQPGGAINALLFVDGRIYVGGNFFGISGSSQQYFALLTGRTDAGQLVKTFNPAPDGQVRAFFATADRIYVAGDFSRIAGQDRRAFAALDPNTGLEQDPLDVQITGQGQIQGRAMLPIGQALYLGGQFRGAGGENRGRLASVHNVFGAATSWDPGADQPVNALARGGNVLLAGGEFTRLGLRGLNPPATAGESTQFLAAFETRPSISEFRKNTAGHYMFNFTDGDGLGTNLLIQGSDRIKGGTWQTLGTLDVLGLQDPFEDTSTATGANRFYRLVRQ